MSRFLERQLKSAESKKLGRTEHFYDYDTVTNQVNSGERHSDAAKRPPNTINHAFPVGRTMSVVKPGEEDRVGRMSEGYGPAAIGGARPALKKHRKPR